jgi:hypothetical protein
MITEEEYKFLDKIDCNFPYLDKQESRELIIEASFISANALFSVIEEICRIPISIRPEVPNAVLFELLYESAEKVNHPIKELVVETAEKMLQDQELTVEEVIEKMQIIRKYPGQFAALSILYSSCDDTDGKLEAIWNTIINEWRE